MLLFRLVISSGAGDRLTNSSDFETCENTVVGVAANKRPTILSI